MSLTAVKSEWEMQELEMIKQPQFTPFLFKHNDAVFSYVVIHIYFPPRRPSLFNQQAGLR